MNGGGERWAGISNDIADLITSRLEIGDIIHVSQVCKSWRTQARDAIKPIGISNGSPCFISLADDNQTCTIIDPLSHHEFAVDVPHFPDNAQIVAAKHGWLLLLALLADPSIFFFHPLKKATIELPRVSFFIPDFYTFSSPPTSADCVVTAHYACRGYSTICICRRGDSSWKELKFYEEGSFTRSFAKPVISRGKMYCLGRDGAVGVFDLSSETWRVFPANFQDRKPNIFSMYLASFDDELLAVFRSETNNKDIHLFKMDLRSEITWVEVRRNTGAGKWFFAGEATSRCSAAASPEAVHRIYFPMRSDGEFVYYAFERGEFRAMQRLECAKGTNKNRVAWIEPTWEEFSYEDLDWYEEEDDFCYCLRDLFHC